jgi:class 3 adenylate cyclase
VTEERRLVTVLFADVVGSTALGEAFDPEDVRPLLARLFAIARDAVEEHGGRVEKYIGDAVMAVFGLPVAHDDDAARALSAALNLRDRVQADAMLGDRLPIRLGVNTGEVIATRDPQANEFLLTGDPVNTAARLQQTGDEWAIVVGERTVRAVGDRFAFGSPKAVEAKGKATPVQTRQLLGPVSAPAMPPLHPLVGRDADLAQLELVGRRAFGERRPYLVSIVAPAGVGKSRLLEEFLDGIGPGPATIAIAQCLPYGQRLTYWPMRAILLSILRLAEDIGPEALRETLRDWLATAGDPEAQRTAEQLAATFGASESDVGDRLALFAAWSRFIELAAGREPLVLVIEDLHWSSDSLLDLIEAILQPHADVPLLMIALARPELLDRRPTWGGGRRNAVSIALEPLADDSVAELVGNLLEAPAPEITQAVVDRAEGNPFYAGEIVRSLFERLGSDPSPEAVRAAVAALPDTVHATVLARLDALEPTARRTVQLAAVLGRSFPAPAISDLEPSLAGDLTRGLAALVDRDIIRAAGPQRYVFRHILLREVAYGTLPRAERARLHAAAGTWLEGQAVASGREDELAELIAFHFREAAALGSLIGSAIATNVTGKAIEWLRRAAESAHAGAAGPEAARHLEAAIELALEEDRAELYERLGEIWVSGQQALGAFQKAYETGLELRLGRDQELRTLAQKSLVASRWVGSVSVQYDAEQSRELRRELRQLRTEATSDRARLLGLLAETFLASMQDRPSAEDIEDAAATSAQAVDLASRLGDVDLMSASLDAEFSVAGADNRHTQALAISRRRLDLTGLAFSERLDALITDAWSLFLLGQLQEAERVADGVRAGLAPGQASQWVMGAAAWRVEALWALGRWDEALVEAGRGEQAWRESEIRAPGFAVAGFLVAFAIAEARRDPVGMDRWRTDVETILARVDPTSRVRPLATAYLGKDLAQLAQAGVADFLRYTSRTDYCHLALARIADRRHPVEIDQVRALLAYMDERGLQLTAAQARRLIGLLEHDADELQRSLELFRAMGARPFVARVTTELGEVRDEADLIDEGVSMLESLGDLDQAERVVRRRRADRS